MKYYIITAVVSLVLGMGVTKKYFPTIQEVNVEKEVLKTDVKTVVKVIERKDGTKETVTEIIDKTVKKESKSVAVTKPTDYHLTALVTMDFDNSNKIYGLSLEKRVFSNIFLGINGNTANQFGISIGLEF
jgi:hypothetical protein